MTKRCPARADAGTARSALRPGLRRAGALLALAGAAGGLLVADGAWAEPAPAASSGQQMFYGEQAMVARLPGHALALPAAAVRCINCHAAPASAGGSASAIAPALSRSHLLDRRARRGGPPSGYDAPAFCRLLRDGLDPASVMIDTTMPRYTMSQPDCLALWAHLTTR